MLKVLGHSVLNNNCNIHARLFVLTNTDEPHHNFASPHSENLLGIFSGGLIDHPLIDNLRLLLAPLGGGSALPGGLVLLILLLRPVLRRSCFVFRLLLLCTLLLLLVLSHKFT